MLNLFSQFQKNVNEGDSRSSLFRFGSNGVITTIRSPLTFVGVNQFYSNIGGCMNINNAKVDINGTLNFTNNRGTPLGGAIRIVGLSLVSTNFYVCMYVCMYVCTYVRMYVCT